MHGSLATGSRHDTSNLNAITKIESQAGANKSHKWARERVCVSQLSGSKSEGSLHSAATHPSTLAPHHRVKVEPVTSTGGIAREKKKSQPDGPGAYETWQGKRDVTSLSRRFISNYNSSAPLKQPVVGSWNRPSMRCHVKLILLRTTVMWCSHVWVGTWDD